MKPKRKKRAVTLIEIMIVILLIGLIGGALAFNMKGSMEKGKVFKSEQNCARISDALMMAYAEGKFDIETECANRAKVKSVLKKSPLIKNVDKVLKDGWGVDITIECNKNGDLVVSSAKADAWNAKNN